VVGTTVFQEAGGAPVANLHRQADPFATTVVSVVPVAAVTVTVCVWVADNPSASVTVSVTV
jgi:hypothetical protein